MMYYKKVEKAVSGVGEEMHDAGPDERSIPPSKRNKQVRWGDEVEDGSSLEEIQEFEKQKEIMGTEADIERVLQDIDRVKQEIERRDQMKKQLQAKIQNVFGEVKASFDDDQTLRESEQSLEMAFMPKADMDKKKTEMLEMQKKLEEETNQLIHQGKSMANQYNTLQQEYVNFMGKPYVPGREIQRREAAMQQHVNSMNEMKPNDKPGQSFPETSVQPRTGADVESALNKNGPPLGTVPKQTAGRGSSTSQYEMQRLYQSTSPLQNNPMAVSA